MLWLVLGLVLIVGLVVLGAYAAAGAISNMIPELPKLPKSKPRGAGRPIHRCGDGMDHDGALCYPACKDGYTGIGPVCWRKCPPGFRNDGAFCFKPKAYGRGAGYISRKKCHKHHHDGCDKYGLLYYPTCKKGYSHRGCCICSPKCPEGTTDIGISCAKKSYGRGAGHPLSCDPDEEQQGGLCYKKCPEGWKGVGPVCWER